jgi:hypothetical protein
MSIIQEIKRHWKDVTAWSVILVGLATICGVLLVDTDATNTSVALKTGRVVTATASPAKAVMKKPVTPTPSATIKGGMITYVVTGSPAMVTYGVDSKKIGSVPMKVTVPFDMKVDDTYTLMAMQTDEGETGKTVIKIYLDGKLMGKSSATSEHKTATITVYKDFSSGKWVSARGAS